MYPFLSVVLKAGTNMFGFEQDLRLNNAEQTLCLGTH